ncbi:MAG: phosphoglycerate kinase [Firmicutes bacterium]|nr:phosphoglycerate kinase [Bacillota bacterium]
MKKKTIRDIEVGGRRVFVRVDFNVPVDSQGNITDDTRIRAAIPTIEYLADRRARVILASHFGRPKGKPEDAYRLNRIAERLSALLGRPVRKMDDCVGDEVRLAVTSMNDGDVVLLENVRFHPGEEKNDESFAKALASLAEVYVNDAFGAAHRAHASTAGVAKFLPAVAGFLMEKEVEALSRVLESPARPFVAVLGGAKVSDKIGVLENLTGKADALILGGGMANTFLRSRGYSMGKSLVEEDKLGVAASVIEKASRSGTEVMLPTDFIVAEKMEAGAATRTVVADAVPDGWMALDIGPKSAAAFAEAIKGARTVFWNGPMGVFEIEQFSKGTVAVANAIAGSGAMSVVGGGDSVAAVEKAGVAEKMGHISTGGGASLEFVEGRELPGVASLMDA